MIALHITLIGPAEEAGMKVPPDEIEDFDTLEYPHWHVYCLVQLGRPMPTPSSHWRNAEIIANIPDDKIMKITYAELVDLGLE